MRLRAETAGSEVVRQGGAPGCDDANTHAATRKAARNFASIHHICGFTKPTIPSKGVYLRRVTQFGS